MTGRARPSSLSSMQRVLARVTLLLACFIALGACKRRPTGDELSEPAEPTNKTLPELKLTDDTPDLLLTWVDGKGDAHVVSKPADVPVEGRDRVRVVVTTREDGTHNLFYVTNLTVKGNDGSYPVSTMTRLEWDNLISERRQALAVAAAASAAAQNPTEPPLDPVDPSGTVQPAGLTVIVYGASWCGACHQAVAYLKRRKVPVVEKDIEQDPAADREMRAKLARAGVHGGSIPVIDVKGKILVGFEPHALEAAMAGANAVTL